MKRYKWVPPDDDDDPDIIEKQIEVEDNEHPEIRVWVSAPKGKNTGISLELIEEDTSDTEVIAAYLAGGHTEAIFDHCAAAGVTKEEVDQASDIISAIVDAIRKGDRVVLNRLGAVSAQLVEPELRAPVLRAKFVEFLREEAARIKAAAPVEQDKLIASLISKMSSRYSRAFSKLEPERVKHAVNEIDPYSTGGRAKKGPSYLAARLILSADAGAAFQILRKRGADDAAHLEHVKQSLQDAGRVGRGGMGKAGGKKP